MTKFKKWLIDNRYSVRIFSKKIGVPYATLNRIVRGETEARVSIALLIEKNTLGEISIKDLARSKANV